MSKLIPVQKRVQHMEAKKLLVKKLKLGCKECKGKVLGFQGGNIKCNVWWNKKHDFWYYLESDKGKKPGYTVNRSSNNSVLKRKAKKRIPRTVLFLGQGNPNFKKNLSITVEINMPMDSLSRQVAGCFLVDSKGEFYIGHSGKIGGGRKGIGRAAFAGWYSQPSYSVDWEGKIRELLFCFKIKSKGFQEELKKYVSKVEEFKEIAIINPDIINKSNSKLNLKSYAKEFSGLRKSYSVEQQIQAKVTHGDVVDGLKNELETRFKYKVYSDNRRDLYIEKSRGVKPMIFEIKTGVLSGDLVKAIGQLFYYPAIFEMDQNTKRFLVIPNQVENDQINYLETLGIKVIRYKHCKKVRFYGLNKAINSKH